MAEKQKKKKPSLREDVRGNKEQYVTVPVSAWTSLVNSLQTKYSMANVVDTATVSDPLAKQNSRRVMNRQNDKKTSIQGEKVSQVISQSGQVQAEYLLSIDRTLKDMRETMKAQQAQLKLAEAKQAALSSQLAAKIPSKRTRIKRGNKKTSPSEVASNAIMEDLKDAFSFTNFLKYGASIAFTGYDVLQGFNKSGDWGVSPILGSIGALIGGQGKGGALNAISKGFNLATLGAMLYGPIGGMVGAIVGAIGGWLGGEEVSKFLSDITGRIASTVFQKMTLSLSDSTTRIVDRVTDKTQDIWDNLVHMGEDLAASVKNVIVLLFATFKDKLGGAFKAIGSATGLDFLKNTGEYWNKEAEDMRNSIGAGNEKRRLERENEKKEKERKRKDRDANRTATEEQHTVIKLFKGTANPELAPDFVGPPTPENLKKKTDNNNEGFISKVKKFIGIKPEIAPDLTVGQVPGDDIKQITHEANQMNSEKFKDLPVVPPEALASIISKESSGNLHPTTGDGNGVTQLRAPALKDVNDAFGTNFTIDDVRNDYKSAIKASALFMRLKLRQNKNDLKSAFASYNGAGRQAELYSLDAMNKLSTIPQDQKPTQLAVVPPTPKQQGLDMTAKAKENEDIKATLATQSQKTSSPVIAPNVTNINNNATYNQPMPTVRNDESSLLDVMFKWN